MSVERFFIDTNVFVYTFDADVKKRETARALVDRALQDGNGCISYQVVQEFLNVATRKFAIPLATADAQQFLAAVLDPLCEVYASAELYRQGLEISERWKYSFYDSMIIAAARAAGCDVLYSEDLQHGQVIGTLKIVNPFL